MTSDEMRAKASALLELACDQEEGDSGDPGCTEIAAAIWGVGAEVVEALRKLTAATHSVARSGRRPT